MRAPLLVASLALVASIVLLTPAAACAQDGAYGRLDGDLTIELSAGAGATFTGDVVGVGVTGDVRLRFLDMVGLMAGIDARPDSESRVLVMADLRPIWFARFLLGASVGDRWVDLFIDSIGVELGVAVAPLDERVGVGLAVGFGVDLPLAFFGAGIEGLSLRLYGRHVASSPTDRVGSGVPLNDWIAGGALVLRLQAHTGASGWEPDRYRLRR